MTIAAHVSAAYTIPAALLIIAMLVGYWIRLGRSDVPSRRRRVRRVSLVGALLSLPAFVAGLTFFDPAAHPIPYVIAWSLALIAVVFVCITALFDMYVSLQLQRERLSADLADARAELREALKRRGELDDASEVAANERNDS